MDNNQIKKVKILGIDYRVTFVTPNISATQCDLGEVLNAKCVINIDITGNSVAHGKSVLLHEIIEALDFRLELKLEHRQITSLEAGLFAVIKDNPKLLEFLRA